jgi:hypothetical protein
MANALRPLPALVLALSTFFSADAGSPNRARVLVGPQTPMVYVVHREDPGFGATWTAPDFDDSRWTAGAFPVGLETGTPVGARALIRTELRGTAPSVYCRSRFVVEDPAALASLYLGADYDDGFVAWINGVEVARSPSMPAGVPRWDTRPASHESSNGSLPRFHPRRDISDVGIGALRAGENVLAVGLWNHEPDSSDLLLAVELLADQPLKTFVTRGPYLQLATDTAVTIRWRTDRPTDSRVSYGPAPERLTSSAVDPAATTDHRIRLTGLEPDSTVFYAVGTSTTVLAGGDGEHVFRTAPPEGSRRPLRFWVVGDAGTGGGIPGWVFRGFTSWDDIGRTDLWLALGDLAYGGADDRRFQAALFETFPQVLRRASVWPTPGNHDHAWEADGAYYEVFDNPRRGEAGGVASGTEAYYSFDFGNVHFVSLDSEIADLSEDAPMLAWLERDLEAAAADWIVVFWHRAPYSRGRHDSDDDGRTVLLRRSVLPVLDAHGVDLVLTGHTHSCQRSMLLHGHYGPSDSLAPSMMVDVGDGRPGGEGPYRKTAARRAGDGIVYAVVGCSGEATEKDFSHPVVASFMDAPGSLVVDVDGLRLDARYIDRDGRVRDHFAIVRERAPTRAARP